MQNDRDKICDAKHGVMINYHTNFGGELTKVITNEPQKSNKTHKIRIESTDKGRRIYFE